MEQSGVAAIRLRIGKRLAFISDELVSKYKEKAALAVGETKAYNDAFMASQEPSVSGREAVARANAVSIKLDRIPIDGEIEALKQEQDNLRFIVKWELWEVYSAGE